MRTFITLFSARLPRGNLQKSVTSYGKALEKQAKPKSSCPLLCLLGHMETLQRMQGLTWPDQNLVGNTC